MLSEHNQQRRRTFSATSGALRPGSRTSGRRSKSAAMSEWFGRRSCSSSRKAQQAVGSHTTSSRAEGCASGGEQERRWRWRAGGGGKKSITQQLHGTAARCMRVGRVSSKRCAPAG